MPKSKLRKNRKNPKNHIDFSGKPMSKNSIQTINNKIKNRYEDKLKEFETKTDEQLADLQKSKMSSTDFSALEKVIKQRFKPALEESVKKEE